MEDNETRIDRYLRNEMTDDERRIFESDLEHDDHLRTDFEITKGLVDTLRDRREKIDLINQWLAEDRAERRVAPKPFLSMRRWTVAIGVAACLAIGFFGVKSLFFPAGGGKDGFAMPTFSDGYVFRGASGVSPLDSLIDAGDYTQALSLAKELMDGYNRELEELENDDEATPEEIEARRDRIAVDRYNLEWRYINLLLATDNGDEAIGILKDYISTPGIYMNRADSLYHTLR